jgi:hypothetical protein
MAGVYGSINSRDDFHRVLFEATVLTRKLLGSPPHDEALEVIDTQLDAITRWVAGGREPTEGERSSINVGLIAVRELDPPEDEAHAQLASWLSELNNYFEDWPSDTAASSATDADFWNDPDA